MKKEEPAATPLGKLYLVSTPIGNLADISFRAIHILKEVDLIAAEDTRRTKILLNHYQIKTPTTSYFEHNELKKGKRLVERMKRGENIALVSDAGTPAISDPGYRLLQTVMENNISVISIPGASAVIAALSISGLPTDSFIFEGFLPVKSKKRKNLFQSLAEERRTLIFYESPYRLHSTLQDLLEVLGDRKIVVARELTKLFEEVIRGNATNVIEQIEERRIKGEITLMVAGKKRKPLGKEKTTSA